MRKRPHVAANEKRRLKAYSKTEQYRLAQKNHKARRRAAAKSGEKITFPQWQALVARFRGACAYCGRTDVKLTMDHVVPLAKGGAHALSNIVPACSHCNSSKRDQDWSDRIAHTS
ncbi:MAG: HNH endonuclease [Sphingomonadaceae bacterium]|nr:HNH endonuclease [Sphingomonadaceae bacterium]